MNTWPKHKSQQRLNLLIWLSSYGTYWSANPSDLDFSTSLKKNTERRGFRDCAHENSRVRVLATLLAHCVFTPSSFHSQQTYITLTPLKNLEQDETYSPPARPLLSCFRSTGRRVCIPIPRDVKKLANTFQKTYQTRETSNRNRKTKKSSEWNIFKSNTGAEDYTAQRVSIHIPRPWRVA